MAAGFSTPIRAHPFENPTPLSNFLELVLIFAISSGLTYTLGRMTGSQRHGWAVWSAMAILFLIGVSFAYSAESKGNPLLHGVDQTSARSSQVAIWKARKCASESPIRRSAPRYH